MARLLASAARPVVVPLGARQRVLAGAVARRERARRRALRTWRLAGAGAVVVGAVLIVWFVAGRASIPEPLARVAASHGEVQVEQPGRGLARAQPGAQVVDGARLTTSAGGHAQLRFADLELRLGPATGTTVRRRGPGGVSIQLEHGEVGLVVSRRPPERPVAVSAGGYSVTVIGTVFGVKSSADGIVEVTVAEGVVRVAGRGVERLVRAGEAWASRLAAARTSLAPPPWLAPPDRETAAPPPRSADAGGGNPGREKHPQPARRRAERQFPRRLATTAARPPQPARASPRTAVAVVPALEEAPPVAAAAPPAAPARGRHPAAQPAARYEEAMALAASGRHADAAAVFGRVAAGGGAQADLALYQRGLILLRALGDAAGARRAFLDHRRRFPESSLAPDVDLWLIETSLSAREPAAAAGEIEAFLARHPASERRDEVVLLRADLARDAGDCARAERDYQALARGTGRAAQEALHSSAYCRRRLGDETGARERLREYLRRFPAGRHRRDVEQAFGGAGR
jgi:TolA-binding protein